MVNRESYTMPDLNQSFDLIITPLTPYQVLFVLGFSAIFTLAIDFPKYEAFKKFGL